MEQSHNNRPIKFCIFFERATSGGV